MTLLDHLPSLQRAATPRIDPAVWPSTATVDALGRLCVGDVPLTEVADQFRTPTHVIDEIDFRRRLQRYRAQRDIEITYDASSLLTTAVAGWVADEGAGLAVHSAGELTIALAGGVDAARIIMHGDVRDGAGVGRVVVDSAMDVAYLACAVRRPQPVLIGVTADDDIEGHTAQIAKRVLQQPLLTLVGLHCPIDMHVTETIPRMIAAMADIRAHHGAIPHEVNLGGPAGGDPAGLADVIGDALDRACAAERFARPRVVVELGPAISAQAGVTLLGVTAVESRPGGDALVWVDGGISEDSLHAKPSIALANRHPLGPTTSVIVAGHHCHDVLARDVELPADVHPGELLAVAGTGADQHSKATNYHVVGRPPVIAVKRGRATELVRRETTADLLARDLGWSGGVVPLHD
jgi:diaminopimelate decarboxylase